MENLENYNQELQNFEKEFQEKINFENDGGLFVMILFSLLTLDNGNSEIDKLKK